jgi:putative transposase
MEMEVEEQIGAARHERTKERSGQRNGCRQRAWDTRAGTVELKVPRMRDSSYFPSLLKPRKRAERALSAMVQEAYAHGISIRKVDDLVKALGMGGISKSRVCRLCEGLDEEVERFRGRPVEGAYPYVWIDATYVKCRQDGRVVSMVAVVIAVGVKGGTGEQECWAWRWDRARTGRVLERLPALAERSWPLWGEAGDQSDAHRA